ncbi:unnamed protein product [Miscanthus lutarioriparius]|uniref:RBR-type E3 ubiquitin transferase n=1 Tax=Miscanthus lutarioriparius TaxID=422564 RepID=A0A811NQG8_9POAL|nr:unnamed protein product [Miscanthus lutarioriparius]
MDHQSKEEAIIRDAMAPDVVEAVVGGLRTPKFVDGSKQEAAVRDAASTSADTVETGTQNNAMIFWDDVDEDDYWVQQEDLDAPLDVDVAQVVNPWLDFLMATVAPETAALLPSSAPFMPTPTFSTLAPMSTPTTSLLPDKDRSISDSEAEYSCQVRGTTKGGTLRPEASLCRRRRTRADPGRLLQDMGPPPVRAGPRQTWPVDEEAEQGAPLADDEVAKFDCSICLETLPILDLFHGMQCDHKFCAQCMATYIEGRIRDGGVSILCPDPACKEAAGEGNNGGVLNPEHCKKSIDFAAFCSWGDRLTEKAIPQDQRVYCPNPRCGLMLERTFGANKQAPCKASCPACNHPMCTTCGLGWVIDGRDDDHHDCDEGKGAALVKELAAQHRWKQCPSCKIVVEKIMGCDTMHCRC